MVGVLKLDVTKTIMKVAVLFHRLGPYHFARLKATSELCCLHAIEFSSVDDTYAWDILHEETGIVKTTLFTDSDVEKKSSAEILSALGRAFRAIEPDVVAIPGWSGRPAFLALASCRQMNIPTIAMSESAAQDQVRHYWVEWVKTRVVGNFSAALVGGRPHVEYMKSLGMPQNRIFMGYDVVDNNYFSTGANEVRKNESKSRANYHLPEKYFLNSNRFISKKNIDGLIRAYAQYRAVNSALKSWKLVILGDGELRPKIECLIKKLSLDDEVILPGFKQYQDLPAYYGLAKAYIHASTTEQWGLVVNEAMSSGLPVLISNRCGCASDLVENGRNGFTFDPFDGDELAQLMATMSSMECNCEQMGQASLEIISHWTPATFAAGLVKSAQAALSSPSSQVGSLDKTLLWLLGRKR